MTEMHCDTMPQGNTRWRHKTPCQRIRLFFVALTALPLLAVLCACAPRPAAAHPFDESFENVVVSLESYRQLADENPDDVELQYLYADMLIMAGQLDKAEQVILKRVVAKDPDYDMAYYLLSEVYYRQKNYKKALEPLKKIKAGDMKDEVLIAEATIYLQMKEPKKCLEKAKAAMKADSTNPGGHLHVGLAYIQMKDTTRGMQHMEMSLRMDPYQPLVYDWLKEQYKANLSLEEHLKRLETILAEVPYESDFGIRVRNDIKALKKQIAEKKSKGKGK